MAKVRRFVWVHSPRRDAASRHIKFSEGGAACGRWAYPGWKITTSRKLPRCKVCEAAAP